MLRQSVVLVKIAKRLVAVNLLRRQATCFTTATCIMVSRPKNHFGAELLFWCGL